MSRKGHADVILPAGASLEVNNEVSGMRKNYFALALRKEGIEDVKFYNAGGALGLNETNQYFAGKDIEVGKLKQRDIMSIAKVNPKEVIMMSGGATIESFSAFKDDANHWSLYVKPEGEKPFTVEPSSADLNTFFRALRSKDTNRLTSTQQELGKKYYTLVLEHPELRSDALMPKYDDSIDLSRINNVRFVKSKEDNKVLMFISIDGEKVPQKPISKEDWSRYFLADDKEGFKAALAAKVFSEELKPEVKQEVEEQQTQGQGQTMAAPLLPHESPQEEAPAEEAREQLPAPPAELELHEQEEEPEQEEERHFGRGR